MATNPRLGRDRHGRGIRRPMPSKLFRHGVGRASFFEQVVSDTCEFLRETWPEELAELNWRIQDAPLLDGEVTSVQRWAARKQTMTITLYRIPIQRLHRFRDNDERMQIERAVFSAAAALIDRDPWDLLHRHS